MRVPDPDSPEVVYSGMRWNTPLSEDHADRLLDALDQVPGEELLDLGCGWGELMMRGVVRTSGGHGTGVEDAAWAVERARRLAGERGLGPRATFVVGDCSVWDEPADRVLCIGASHAWGGSGPALAGLVKVVRPGGRLIFGDGFWEKTPTEAALAVFGPGILPFRSLLDQAAASGWTVLRWSTADQGEWDDFESAWRAGRESWLQRNPGDHRAVEVARTLDVRLQEYLTVYRQVLGFAYLVLAPTGAP